MRILTDKGFLRQTNDERPFTYEPVRTFDEVSGTLLGDLLEKVFGGSREQLLIRLVDGEQLSKQERELLQNILREQTR